MPLAYPRRFSEGFFGVAYTRSDSLYHIPGIDAEDHHTRIDAHQDKWTSKGEWRPQAYAIDSIRFWAGVTDYRHNELGLSDDRDLTSDARQQTFTNKEQEFRVETQLLPITLPFATLTTGHGPRLPGSPSLPVSVRVSLDPSGSTHRNAT